MHLSFKFLFLTIALVVINGCSTYSTEDYADPKASKKESLCINMEPAQAMKCKEREQTLHLSLGADKNCNHAYEYERNRCKAEQAKHKKALADITKKT